MKGFSKTQSQNLFHLSLYAIIPTSVIALFNFGEVIPYIGVLFQLFKPILFFFLFCYLGVSLGEMAQKNEFFKRSTLFVYLILVCTISYVNIHAIGYYAVPLKVIKAVNEKTHKVISYSEASVEIDKLLLKEVGSKGVLSFAIYTERIKLRENTFKKHITGQFQDIDDLGGLISAVINIILISIPMALKWILNIKLQWVSEVGLIGLVFWYLIALLFSYLGWKSEI
jgi:hypothetical protein